MPIERVFRDPLDAERGVDGQLDITAIRVSDRQGNVSIRMTVKGLRADPHAGTEYENFAHVFVDANCDGKDDLGFGVSSGGDGFWERLRRGSEIVAIGPIRVVRTGDTSTIRFAAARFGVGGAFRFWADAVDYDPEFAPFGTDMAPNDGTWLHDLTSR